MLVGGIWSGIRMRAMTCVRSRPGLELGRRWWRRGRSHPRPSRTTGERSISPDTMRTRRRHTTPHGSSAQAWPRRSERRDKVSFVEGSSRHLQALPECGTQGLEWTQHAYRERIRALPVVDRIAPAHRVGSYPGNLEVEASEVESDAR